MLVSSRNEDVFCLIYKYESDVKSENISNIL